ncbi:hypothetical protein Fmac_003356 [Flemingia macrophylla]|uniref:Uncharacterized protein n=1 Tax=Flemingia macrophylla TaxID=520843 RepID=A0ABD1NMN6_9FABA
MGLLQRPSCCSNSKEEEHHHHHRRHQQPHSQQDHSESSSLSSQPSLPSVPSLTPQNHHHQPPQTTLLATVKIHTSPISALALHAKSLFSASSDGQVKTCSRDPFTLQTSPNTNAVVAATTAPIKSLIVHNDALFTAHQDHKVRVWKTDPRGTSQTYKCVATVPTFHDRLSKLFSSKNYVQIRRHKKRTWVHHVDAVSALALSPDTSLLYSASWDRTFKLWRTSDFKCLDSVHNAHDDAINALIVSQNGVVFTGSADTKIKMWKNNNSNKKEKHFLLGTLEKHRSAVNALALSDDGLVLYSGACDRSILVWESDGGSEGMVVVGALRGHTKAILCLVVVGDLVCSGSADKSVRVWRRGVQKGYSCLAVLEAHQRPVKSLAMAAHSSNNGGPPQDTNTSRSYLVYSAGLDCHIKVWQIQVPN